MYLTLIEIVFC